MSDDDELIRLAGELNDKTKRMDGLYASEAEGTGKEASRLHDECSAIVARMLPLKPGTDSGIVAKMWALMFVSPEAFEGRSDGTTQGDLFQQIFGDMQRVHGLMLRRVN